MARFGATIQRSIDDHRPFSKSQDILDRAADRPGHIFNLGHGVLQQTPLENAQYLVEAVRELSRK